LSSVSSPVVFCHNDLQEGKYNILLPWFLWQPLGSHVIRCYLFCRNYTNIEMGLILEKHN